MFTNHIYLLYMNKLDLALNNNKTKQTEKLLKTMHMNIQ